MQSEEKMCVVVLFGGMSSEHEVSRVSAGTVVTNMDRSKYEVMTIGITKAGRWLYTEATTAQMADGSWEELAGNMPCVLSPDRADHGLILFTPAGQVEKIHVDVVVPVLHGLWGEDGTVQGLLELAGIPYVGCGVLASAVCMDKAVANAMFDASGIPHTKWLSATRWEIESDPDGVCDGAILAPQAVEHRDHHVKVHLFHPAVRGKQDHAVVGAVRADHAGHIAGQLFPAAVGHLLCRGLGVEPAALLGDAHGEHLVFAAVDVADKVAHRDTADLMFAGHTAKQQRHAHFICRLHDISLLFIKPPG